MHICFDHLAKHLNRPLEALSCSFVFERSGVDIRVIYWNQHELLEDTCCYFDNSGMPISCANFLYWTLNARSVWAIRSVNVSSQACLNLAKVFFFYRPLYVVAFVRSRYLGSKLTRNLEVITMFTLVRGFADTRSRIVTAKHITIRSLFSRHAFSCVQRGDRSSSFTQMKRVAAIIFRLENLEILCFFLTWFSQIRPVTTGVSNERTSWFVKNYYGVRN